MYIAYLKFFILSVFEPEVGCSNFPMFSSIIRHSLEVFAVPAAKFPSELSSIIPLLCPCSVHSLDGSIQYPCPYALPPDRMNPRGLCPFSEGPSG